MDSDTEKFDDDLFDEIIEFDADECDKDNQTQKKSKAKKLQMNKLKLFMEEHRELLVEKDEDLWGNLTNELNALGPPYFTPSEWKLKWSQHKYNKKRNLSTEIAGPSTETAQPPTKIAKTSRSDWPDRSSITKINKCNPRPYINDITKLMFLRGKKTFFYANSFDEEFNELDFIMNKEMDLKRPTTRDAKQGINPETKKGLQKLAELMPLNRRLFLENL